MSFKTGDEEAEVEVKTRIGQNAPGLSKEPRGGEDSFRLRFAPPGAPHLQPLLQDPPSSFRETRRLGCDTRSDLYILLKPQVPS